MGGSWYFFDKGSQDFIPLSDDVVSLRLGPNITPDQVENLEASEDIQIGRILETSWADADLGQVVDLLEKADSLQNHSLIDQVELSSAPELTLQANDSLMQASSPLGGPPPQWSIAKAQVDQAWNITTGDTSAVIAIMDNGVDWWLPDFRQASNTTNPFWTNPGEDAWSPVDTPGGNGIDDDGNGYVDDWRGWNFADGNNNVQDFAGRVHGTPVASIATARSNNTEGMAGVAGGWGNQVGAKTMILRMLGNTSTPNSIGSTADDAILYAAQNGADVINIAMHFYTNIASIDAAIHLAKEKYNSIIIASSGNDSIFQGSKPVRYPARHPEVIGVANTNSNDRVNFSRIGPNLDLGAPGQSLPAMNAKGFIDPGTPYVITGGTSLSAPFVSGVAALMYSINPCINADEVGLMLRHRAEKVNAFSTPNNLSGYKYYSHDSLPGLSEEIGYGRVNALRAVQTAQNHKTDSLDLYIKDDYRDFGYPNSYPDSARFDDWSDIWVRNDPDGFQKQEMDEIHYDDGSDSTAFVYVKVRNKSCVNYGGGDSIGVYWSKASTASSWPQNWNGSNPSIGNQIGKISLPPLNAGEDTIFEFAWTIAPDTLQSWGTCIMARITSSNDPITAYPSDLALEIRDNNNIALRNVHVLRINPGKSPPVINEVEYPYGIQIYSGNPKENNLPIDLYFDIPPNQTGEGLVGDAELRIFLSDEFWQVFQESEEKILEGLEVLEEKVLLINSPRARLYNLDFGPAQRASYFFGVNFLAEQVDSNYYYRYHITEYQEGNIIGSMNFNIQREARNPFSADAGPDQYIFEGESAELTATGINESADYFWYDNQGNLVGEGQNITVNPSATSTYTLEVTANIDLYKAYDEATIFVNPYQIESLSPNPANQSCQVIYDADGATTAQLLITKVATGTTIYSQNIPPQQTQSTLKTSNISAGNYLVLLVCDGMVAHAVNLQIQ
jgi:hypothetical protein